MAADAPRARAISASALLAGAATALLYLGQRALDHARGRAADAAMVLASLHTDFYYRMAIAFWAGGAVGLLVFAQLRGGLTEQGASRLGFWLVRAAPILGLCALLAAWALP